MQGSSIITQNVSTERLITTRRQTEFLCEPLSTEDHVAQPVIDVSPPRWHLAHTTWFFEKFILCNHLEGYKAYHPQYHLLFNSYYIQAGERWQRAHRGALTRPTVREILEYRKHVDHHLLKLLSRDLSDELAYLFEMGINHEQQHQELLLYDIKHILGINPLYPVYRESVHQTSQPDSPGEWLRITSGNYEIGHYGDDFCFDNEKGRHTVFLHDFEIASQLVTKGDFLAFMEAGGYENGPLWLDEGWQWVREHSVKAPMYWIEKGEGWQEYSLGGLRSIELNDPLSHISFYEADAYARWAGYRLPTEGEWEVACHSYGRPMDKQANFVEDLNFRPVRTPACNFLGNLWEWTSSAYGPYPFYQAEKGALGEYNGKFMINQMVLRGGSFATPRMHIRPTYRNFFHPHLRWLFSGIRLARHL